MLPKFPAYPRKPHASGQARIKIKGRTYYLGTHGSKASIDEYERLRAETLSLPQQPRKAQPAKLTVSELLAKWLTADNRDAKASQSKLTARAFVPVCRLFVNLLASEFRAPNLLQVQEALITSSWMTPQEFARCGHWNRRYINRAIKSIVNVFGWGESRGFVPMGTASHLLTVSPVRHTDRRSFVHPDRQPADYERQVKPILRFLSPVVRAILQVQYFAGMRPGEVLRMRRDEIDTTSTEGVWLYKPTTHKTSHRGHDLIKVLGPQAQSAIGPWLMAAELTGYIFPPTQRRNRAETYTVSGYYQAIRRAIAEAKVEPFCLYALRHAAKLRAEKAAGLAGAAAHLGQASIDTAKLYARQQRIDLAIDVAKKIG